MNPILGELIKEYEKHIFGQRSNIRLLLTAILARGHVLLEGVPGTGKTKMVRTLAQLIGGEYQRIQFTPDLMPSDITGNVIYNMKEGQFDTLKGPIFTHLLLGDEINRTPAKTQAALLEAMEEKQVTIHGTTYPLLEPFFLVATQNPIEYEGTYALPEAQQDRFLFKLMVDYPTLEAEKEVLRQVLQQKNIQNKESEIKQIMSTQDLLQMQQEVKEIRVDEAIIDYIAQIVRKTRESTMIRLGASPRAGIAVLTSSQAWAYLEGREFVTPDDVKRMVIPAMRHRMILAPHIELEGGTSEQIIQDVVASIPVPR
ncbi:MAG TPA: magnesium chelatase [Paenibacillaceae bacterium]|nr:magnesium chelatase [Paenibacillaceae bacterium]